MTTMLKKEVMRRKKVSPLVICECHIHSKYMKISCLMQQRLPWRSPSSSSSSWIFSLYQTKSGFLSETLNLEAAPRMQAQSSTLSGGLYIQPHIFFYLVFLSVVVTSWFHCVQSLCQTWNSWKLAKKKKANVWHPALRRYHVESWCWKSGVLVGWCSSFASFQMFCLQEVGYLSPFFHTITNFIV